MSFKYIRSNYLTLSRSHSEITEKINYKDWSEKEPLKKFINYKKIINKEQKHFRIKKKETKLFK